jgi:glycosyltransferase 2 family protein
VAVACSDRQGSGKADDTGSVASAGGDSPRRLERVVGPLRIVVGAVLLALVLFAAVSSWDDVRSTLGRISLPVLLLSGALVLVGLAASTLTWRVAVRELGSPVRVDMASKIYLLGQLGKYVPGSVWALAMQMELATRAGVPRIRGMTASVVAIGVNVTTGLAVGLVLVPTAISGGAWRTFSALAALVVCAIVLSPPVLTRLVDLGLRLARRPQLERAVTWRGILAAAGWSLVSVASYGASLWVLVVAVGGSAGESLPLCVAGMALAMTVGFLVVVAPSGIGVREAVIVAALAPVLNRPDALAAALIARLLFTVVDLVAAAAVLPVRIRTSGAI